MPCDLSLQTAADHHVRILVERQAKRAVLIGQSQVRLRAIIFNSLHLFFIGDCSRYLHNQLTKNPIIHDGNKELITEVLRSVAELMIWGDQHNSAFFDYFCEKNMLGFFPKIMHQRTSARVKVQLIQTLSIMIQNISSEHAIFYFLSNNVRRVY